jgi:hypothetical protein
MASVLNKIAGVYMQQGALNTNKLQSGGARTPFGTTNQNVF